MPSAENMNCGQLASRLSDAITMLYTHGIITEAQRNSARRKLPERTVKDGLTVEPVSNRYEFTDTCFCCGALPADQVNNPWGQTPWIVTKKESGGTRFLIDGRDKDNPDVFTGFAMSVHGKLAKLRYAFHRSHFEEELPD